MAKTEEGTTKEEPNWLKLSRRLDEEYEKSRKKPLLLSREEVAEQLAQRYTLVKKP